MVQADVGVRAPGGAERGPLTVLALLLVAHVGLYAGLFGGFLFDLDTQQYARISWELASGEFVLANHPFSQRFAVTAPTALAYVLFGVDAITTTLWPLTVSLVSVVAIYFATRRFSGPWTGVLAAFLLAANIVQARHASRLLPDVVVAMFMLIAASLLQAARESDSAARQRWFGAIAAACSSVALFGKETVLWAGCFFLILLIKDVAQRKNAVLWRSFAVTCVLCGAAFLATYAAVTGDALYRLAGIESTHNAREHSFFGRSRAEYFWRLTLAPLRFMLATPGYGVPLLLALPCVVHLVWPIRALPRAARYWAGYFVTVLLFFWFGSTSFISYNPLPIVERFLIPFLAPLAILGAITLRQLVFARPETEGRRRGLTILAAGFLASAVLIAGQRPRTAVFYGACGLVVLVLVLRPAALATRGVTVAAWAAVCALYLLPVATYLTGKERVPEILGLELDLLSVNVETLREPTLILTDRHSAFFLPLVLDAETLEHVRLRDWSLAEQYRDDSGRLLVYVHQPRLLATYMNWGFPTPDFTRDPPASLKLIASRTLDQRNWIWLFEIENVDALTSM